MACHFTHHKFSLAKSPSWPFFLPATGGVAPLASAAVMPGFRRLVPDPDLLLFLPKKWVHLIAISRVTVGDIYNFLSQDVNEALNTLTVTG